MNEQANGLFEQGPPPEDRAGCLTEAELVAVADGTAKHGAEHVAQCEHCKGIVQLLQRSATGQSESLRIFLAKASEEARRISGEKRPWFIQRLWIAIAPGRSWQIATAATLVAIAGLSTLNHFNQKTVEKNDVFTTSFDTEEYLSAVAQLRSATADFQKKAVPEEDLKMRVAMLNGPVEKIQRGDLSPQRRAEFAKVVLTAQRALNAQYGSHSEVPVIPSPDAKKVMAWEAMAERYPGTNAADIVGIDDRQVIIFNGSPSSDSQLMKDVAAPVKRYASMQNTRVEYVTKRYVMDVAANGTLDLKSLSGDKRLAARLSAYIPF